MGYIYLITNLINNKVYIGKTIGTIQNRWNQHIYDAYNGNNDNSLLHKAIKKYGKENFIIEKVEECINEALNDKEKFYIQKYNSYFIYGKGYNLTYGGEGAEKYSDEAIIELWNKGYTNSEIAKFLKANDNTISLRIKKLIGESSAQERRAKSKQIKILQFDLSGKLIQEWNSLSEAEKSLHLSKGSLTKCCQKERNFCGGFLWKYSDDSTSISQLIDLYAMSNKCCAVDLINTDGTILKTYSSGKEAELDLGISHGKVSEICSHKKGRKSAKGYKFQWNFKRKRELIENGIK